MSERYPHDVCPKCGAPSIPFEGVPDQSLRGCLVCDQEWFDDLTRPATGAATSPGMTAARLIAELQKLPADAPVWLQVDEPYDDDPATLFNPVTGVNVDADGGIVLS